MSIKLILKKPNTSSTFLIKKPQTIQYVLIEVK